MLEGLQVEHAECLAPQMLNAMVESLERGQQIIASFSSKCYVIRHVTAAYLTVYYVTQR